MRAVSLSQAAAAFQVAGGSTLGVEIDAGLYWFGTDGAAVYLSASRSADAGATALTSGMDRFPIRGTPRFPVMIDGGQVNVLNPNGSAVLVFYAPVVEG